MIELLLTFIVMAVAFIVLFWLKKTLFIFGFFFKLFTFAMLVFIAGSVLFGYAVVKDANDFRSNFINSTSAFIVKDSPGTSETFLAGAALNPEDKEFIPISSEKLTTMERLYKDDDMYMLSPEFYKIFIIDIQSFDEVELYEISDQNLELTGEEVKNIMRNPDAREELAYIVAEKSGSTPEEVLEELTATSEEIKGYLLSYYLTAVFDPGNIGGFLKQLKNGNIEVYKETALFKAVKLVPVSLINLGISKILKLEE